VSRADEERGFFVDNATCRVLRDDRAGERSSRGAM